MISVDEMTNQIYNTLQEKNKDKDKRGYSLSFYKDKKLIIMKTTNVIFEIKILSFSSGLIVNGKYYLWLIIHDKKSYKTDYFVFEIGCFNSLRHEKIIEKLCELEISEYNILDIIKMVGKNDVEEICDYF